MIYLHGRRITAMFSAGAASLNPLPHQRDWDLAWRQHNYNIRCKKVKASDREGIGKVKVSLPNPLFPALRIGTICGISTANLGRKEGRPM